MPQVKPKKKPTGNTFKSTGPKLTNADLDKLEAQLGLKLPAQFRAHYLKWNGGKPSKDTFVVDNEFEHGVHYFSPVKESGRPSGVTLIGPGYDLLVKQKKLLPPRMLPFATNEGGDLYCIDVKDGSIWFWTPDDYTPRNLEKALSKVAPSLPAFVDGMMTEAQARKLLP